MSGEQSVCPPLLFDGHPTGYTSRRLSDRQKRERLVEQQARAQRLYCAGLESVAKTMEC